MMMIIQIYPKSGLALNSKGEVHLGQREYDLAIECFDKAIEIDPEFAVAWSNKGRVLSQYKKFDEAIECYNRAIQVFKAKNFVRGLDNIWVNRGAALGGAGKYSDSLECFDKAIEINANNISAWIVKGINLSILTRYDEAIICLDEGIKINPTESVMWDGKGNILAAIGRYEEAKECYDKSLSLNPNNEITTRNKETAINHIRSDENKMDFETCDLFEHDIKISYPTNWTKIDHSLDPPSIAIFHPPNGGIKNQFLDGVELSVKPLAVYSFTLDDVLELIINDLKIQNPNFILDEFVLTTIAQQPAYRIVYQDSGFKTLTVFTLRQTPSTLVTLIFKAKQTSYSTFLPLVNKMIRSFEFTD